MFGQLSSHQLTQFTGKNLWTNRFLRIKRICYRKIQGSFLSPLLYDIYTSDLAETKQSNTLDDRLSCNAHTESCRTKALKCFSAINPLLHSRSKLSTLNKLILYKTMIRPKITYAAPVWISTNQRNIDNFQRTQNTILKTILGVRRTFPTILLHSTLEVRKIQTVLEILVETFLAKCGSYCVQLFSTNFFCSIVS